MKPLSPRATEDMLAMPSVHEVVQRVRAVLTPDLLSPAQRKLIAKQTTPPVVATTGQCYVAAEAVWHLMGGRHSCLQPYVAQFTVSVERLSSSEGLLLTTSTHWWLETPDRNHIIDPTSDQFNRSTPESNQFVMQKIYRRGRHAAFLTKKPSKRAAEVIRRVRAANRRKAGEHA